MNQVSNSQISKALWYNHLVKFDIQSHHKWRISIRNQTKWAIWFSNSLNIRSKNKSIMGSMRCFQTQKSSSRIITMIHTYLTPNWAIWVSSKPTRRDSATLLDKLNQRHSFAPIQSTISKSTYRILHLRCATALSIYRRARVDPWK